MEYTEIIQAISDGLARLDAAISERAAEIQQLEEEGMINAKEHWRGGKYLYLIHPQKNGERQREYIGADPDKIATARKRMANYQRWHDAQAEKTSLEQQMRYAVRKLEDVKFSVVPRRMSDVQPH
jgi:hypothetical protein